MKIRKVEWKDFHDLVEAYYSYYDELPTNPFIGLTLFSWRGMGSRTWPRRVERP